MVDENFNGRIFIPPNIKTNKQAIVGKFDLRDLVYIAIAGGLFALVFVPCYKLGLDTTLGVVGGLILALPVLICGFKRFDGLKFEEYIFVFKSNKLDSSAVRVNNSDNLYEILEKQKEKSVNNNNVNNDVSVNLNPLAKIIFNMVNKKNTSKKIDNKNVVSVDNSKKIDNKKKNTKIIKSEQLFIYNTIKKLLITDNINSVSDFLEELYELGIESQVFYRKGIEELSFKTAKTKHYIISTKIHPLLKYSKLNNTLLHFQNLKLEKNGMKRLNMMLSKNINKNVVKKVNKNKAVKIKIYR